MATAVGVEFAIALAFVFATSFAIVSATVFAIAFVLANVTALASEPVLLVTEADCTQNRAAHPIDDYCQDPRERRHF